MDIALDERKYRILQAIIDDYINTASPVGSRTISRKDGMGFSPATIRNEMSDLTELGYLDQPHTSSGRVPSWKAYRLYVDQLMRVSSLTAAEQDAIHRAFSNQAVKVEELMERAAAVISDLTNYASIVLSPQLGRLRFRRVQMVPVTENTALVVIVTDLGVVKDAIIHVDDNITSDQLYMISKMLTESLKGRTLSEIPAIFSGMARQMEEHKAFFDDLLGVINRNMQHEQPQGIVLSGATKLLEYPEYADIDKARAIITALETREGLAKLMSGKSALTFSITIGPEMDQEGFADCSLVTVAYHIGGDRVGSVGVIGPNRMAYGRVIGILDSIKNALGTSLRHLGP